MFWGIATTHPLLDAYLYHSLLVFGGKQLLFLSLIFRDSCLLQ